MEGWQGAAPWWWWEGEGEQNERKGEEENEGGRQHQNFLKGEQCGGECSLTLALEGREEEEEGGKEPFFLPAHPRLCGVAIPVPRTRKQERKTEKGRFFVGPVYELEWLREERATAVEEEEMLPGG